MKRLILTCIAGMISVAAFAQNEINRVLQQRLAVESPESVLLFQPQFSSSVITIPEVGEVDELLINDYAIQQIREANLVHFPVQFENEDYSLTFYEHSFVEPDFKVVEVNNGIETEVTDAIQIGKHYRGGVDGYIESFVTLSVYEDEVVLLVSMPGKQFTIHPNGSENGRYLAYETKEIVPPAPVEACSVLEVPNTTTDLSLVQNNLNDEGCGGANVPISYVADFDTFQDFGSSTNSTVNYITSLANQVNALFAADGIELTMQEVFVNSAEDGYPHTSSIDDLDHFQINRPNTSGILDQLISTNNSNLGGVAYLNVLCNTNFNIGYSNTFGTFPAVNIPSYSWDVNVVAHELGHNLGSGHTHGCLWSSGTIDDCGNVAFLNAGETPEGAACWDEFSPKIPSDGGTVMSYCHLNSVGVNFTKGFGDEPAARIRSRIDNATCLPTQSGGDFEGLVPDDAYTTITANRICTDGVWTEYIFDNDTPEFDDDILVMSIRTNGQNIGKITDPGFEVSVTSTTDATFGGGLAVDPDYKTNPNDFFLGKRFWTVNPTTQPSQPVGIRFPIKQGDVDQLLDNVPTGDLDALVVLSLTEAADFDPENGHMNIPYTALDEYTSGGSASDVEYSTRNVGSDIVLEFNSEKLFGGAIGMMSNEGNVTPYVLQSFSASVNDTFGVDINWQSAKEFNAFRYFLEKSFNGSEFQEIAQRPAQGFDDNGAAYSADEEFAFVGETKYRLRMVGNKGTVIFSEEITLADADFGDEVQVYPNPLQASDRLRVDLRAILPTSSATNINIYNIAGQAVRSFEVTGQIIDLDLDGIATGTYFLLLTNENTSKTVKFVKTN
ncbi:MAG: T9SS type A sorting domain-containing protein [Saprospiraceae bacterium]|nr:T9SS type A sorting domain-containing protein [Saprospiraceae bacterium]